MNLVTRIQRAEMRVLGESFDTARVIEMAQRGEYDLMTDTELNWIIGGMRQEIAPETSAEIDRLFESYSEADLTAIMESRELSPEGKNIRDEIYRLLGVTA